MRTHPQRWLLLTSLAPACARSGCDPLDEACVADPRCTVTETTACPDGADPEIPPILQSDAGRAIHAPTAPVGAGVGEGWVEVFRDWETLEARLSELGTTLGAHDDVDFAADQVVLVWEDSGAYCDGGTPFQGIADAVAIYLRVDPCDTRCDVSSVWFGNLFVVPRVDLSTCVDTWSCAMTPGADEAECPQEPAFTMLNAP